MGDAVEVLADVELEEEGEPPAEVPGPLQRGDPAFAPAAGERVGDQPALEDRLADVHDRVVQHPLAKTGCRDQPLLGVEDRELVVHAQREVASQQGRPHPVQVVVRAGRRTPARRPSTACRAAPCARPAAGCRGRRSAQTGGWPAASAAFPPSAHCRRRNSRTRAPYFSIRASPTPAIFSSAALVVARAWTIWASCSLVKTV